MLFDKLLAGIEAALLAFFLSFGACACLVTAFGLSPVNLGTVAMCCALCALIFAIGFSVPYLSLLPMGLLALGLGYLWRRGDLAYATEALVTQISATYHSAYGWNVLFWSGEDLTGMDMTLAVCVIGILICVVATWTVCSRTGVSGAVLISIIPLAACLVVTDKLPDLIFLYLLLLGLVILILSQSVRREDIAQGNTLTALVTAPVAAGLALLFFAIPQANYQMPNGVDQLFSWVDGVLNRTNSTGTYLGFDVASEGAVDLEQVGVRINSRTPVMEVTASTSGTVYLRGRAYDIYQGRTWESSSQADSLYWPFPDVLVPAGELTVTTRAIHQNIYLPYYTEDHYTGDVRQFISNWGKEVSFRYSYMVLPEDYASREVIRPGGGYGGEFTQLPAGTRAWAETVLPEIVQDKQSAVEIANAIADYVRNSARYSTWTRRMPEEQTDFARWFLDRGETGYCVHFATAAAVLLRAAKIPARYVTGYMVPTTAGKTTVVRGEDAHAWVEYWVRGIGWMVLEATPSRQAAPSATAPTEISALPEATTAPTAAPTAPPTQPSTPSGSAGRPTQDTSEPTTDTPPDLGWLWTVLKSIGLLLLIPGVLLGQWRLRLILLQQTLTRGPVNTQALARWRLAAALARRLKEQPDKNLHTLAQKAKFSQHTLEKEELDAFDVYIADCRNRLRRKPLPWQLLYRLVLALY